MKIRDVMTAGPKACSADTNIATAAALMLDADCGVLPVVDKDGMLTGIVTDRDLFIALATRDKLASQLTVGEVARVDVFTCGPDDSVQAALATLKRHHIRRLPVVDAERTVVGIVSMNDLVLAVGSRKGVRSDEVVDTLRGICGHQGIAPHIAA
jgi:CBS domain-containing protein